MASPALKKLIKMGILPEGRKAWDAQVRAMADDPTLIEDFDIRVQSLEETDPALFNEIVSYLDPDDGIGGLTRMGDDLYGAEPAKKTGIRGKQAETGERIEGTNLPEKSSDKGLLANPSKEQAEAEQAREAAAAPKKAGGKRSVGKKKDVEPLDTNEENVFLLNAGLTEDQIRKMTPASRAETLKDFGFKGTQAAETAAPQGGAEPGGESEAMQQARAMLAGSQPPGDPSVVNRPGPMFSEVASPNFAPLVLQPTFSMDTMGMPSGSLADMGNVTMGNPGVMFSESVMPSPEMLPGVQMMDAADLPEAAEGPTMDMSRLNAANFPTIDRLEADRVDPFFGRLGDPRFQNRGIFDQPPPDAAAPLPNEPPPPDNALAPSPLDMSRLNAANFPTIDQLMSGAGDSMTARMGNPRFQNRGLSDATQSGSGAAMADAAPAGANAVKGTAPKGAKNTWGEMDNAWERPATAGIRALLRGMGDKSAARQDAAGYLGAPFDAVARNVLPLAGAGAVGALGYSALSGPRKPPVQQDQLDAVDEMRAKARADLESIIGPMAIPLPPGMQIRAVPKSE